MRIKTTPLILLAFFVMAAVAQTPTPTPETERAAKLREDAVAFLRATAMDVDRMRSIENRISFNSELASLMWFVDEDEARPMYTSVIADLNQLLMRIDGQAGLMQTDQDDYGISFFGGPGSSPALRKFRIAMGVRHQIAMSLAEHSPELAMNFFYDSAGRITNAELRTQLEANDKAFEVQLISRVAETNAARAAEFGRESMKKGVTSQHVELLKKIYQRDSDKGIEFGAAILSRLRTGDQEDSIWVLTSLFQYGASVIKNLDPANGKKPVYSRNDMRDMAEMLAKILLDGDDSESWQAIHIAGQIAEYAPSRAAQIRAKYKSAGNAASNSDSGVPPPPPPPKAANGAVPANGAGEVNDETQMMKDVMSLNSELPKDEREQIIARARDIISRTPGREKKVTALSMLAAQVAAAGDKELASEVMRDAERFVDPYPKNYRDFILSWMLASGYAKVDPDKAFPILENAIYRTNSVIEAFVRVGEFIDVNQELISDGEVQVGAFGGSMISGLLRGLGIANSTVRSLAEADFEKTKKLSNTFDRIETRVLAKMLIIRAVLDKKRAEADLDIEAELEETN